MFYLGQNYTFYRHVDSQNFGPKQSKPMRWFPLQIDWFHSVPKGIQLFSIHYYIYYETVDTPPQIYHISSRVRYP